MIVFCWYNVDWLTLGLGKDVFVSGDTAAFICEPPLMGEIINNWLINGSQLGDLNLTNVRTRFSDINFQGSLELSNLSLVYNNTKIQCNSSNENSQTTLSNAVLLLIEGNLN